MKNITFFLALVLCGITTVSAEVKKVYLQVEGCLRTTCRKRRMPVFASAPFNRIASLLLVAGLCHLAHAGSILVPNAGVEVYHSWVDLSQGLYSSEQVGGTRITREGGIASFSYGVTGT